MIKSKEFEVLCSLESCKFDVVLDECVINGYKVTPFEVNNYICWGTPADLIKYEEIENE